MKTVPASGPECTPLAPVVVAGLVVLVIQLLRELGLELPSIAEATRRLGVSRQRAYEMTHPIREAIAHLPRPPGRPASDASDSDDEHGTDAKLAICTAVRRHLAENPGAHVVREQRDGFSAGFRTFVLGLWHEYEDRIGLPEFAEAAGVRFETIRDWIGGARGAEVAPASSESDTVVEDAPRLPQGVIEQVVTLWRRCGSIALTDFRRVLLEQHRIDLSIPTLVEILRLSSDRAVARPRKPKPDPEAIRGALERFFPGAQWVADGKQLEVQVGQERFGFSWELVVDGFTGAHVGFDVRDEEDATALIHAIDHGVETTGAAPLAVLRDNRPSNLTSDVEAQLNKSNILSMTSTAGRPENKADVEGAFGLFSQRMPAFSFPNLEPRRLARTFLVHVLTAYCLGRNHVPRRGLGGKSAARAYQDHVPTADEQEAARERLLEIQRRINEQRKRNARNDEPRCRAFIAEFFARYALEPPTDAMARSIARHGMRALTEALAIVGAYLDDGRTFSFPDRYLEAVTRSIAERNHLQAVYERTLELRIQDQDERLLDLLDQDDDLRSSLESQPYAEAVLQAALNALTLVGWHFWSLRLERATVGSSDLFIDHLARIVRTCFRVPRQRRDALTAQLVEIRLRNLARRIDA